MNTKSTFYCWHFMCTRVESGTMEIAKFQTQTQTNNRQISEAPHFLGSLLKMAVLLLFYQVSIQSRQDTGMQMQCYCGKMFKCKQWMLAGQQYFVPDMADYHLKMLVCFCNLMHPFDQCIWNENNTWIATVKFNAHLLTANSQLNHHRIRMAYIYA